MEYVVQPGDTLSAIARRFGVSLAALLAVNPEISDPDLIFAGQLIRIPLMPPTRPPVGRLLYVVQPGDTLSGIAARFGIDLTTLINANPQIPNPDLIFPGQVIFIPLLRVAVELPLEIPLPTPGRVFGLELGAQAELQAGLQAGPLTGLQAGLQAEAQVGLEAGLSTGIPMGMSNGMPMEMPMEMEMPFEIPLGAGQSLTPGELPPLPTLPGTPELPHTHRRPNPEDRHHHRHR